MAIYTDIDQLLIEYTEDVRDRLARNVMYWSKSYPHLNDILDDGYIVMYSLFLDEEKGWDPEVEEFITWAIRCQDKARYRYWANWNKMIPKDVVRPRQWETLGTVEWKPDVKEEVILSYLSKTERIVWDLYLQGYNYEGIGMELGMDATSVRQHFCRGRRRLREKMRQVDWDEIR
jgi:DNA-directed RNA polymerase specialized sigma24 family protein